MTEHPIELEALADRLGVPLPSEDGFRELLSSTKYVAAGFGSIARPLFDNLAARGAQRMTIVDPKSYVARSVHSQCEPDEVGRTKVSVGAERLRRLGAAVHPLPCDFSEVADGIGGHDAHVIVSGDNRRVDVLANRLAARTGARLTKINIEPDECTVAARSYDFRSKTSLCVECQFGARHYDGQRHPRSCDGPGEGRPTNSPRWLSRTGSCLALLAVLDLARGGEHSRRWIDCEWQYRADRGRAERSLLSANENCRWDHHRRWHNVERLTTGPESVSLHDIFGSIPRERARRTRMRFCQPVSLGGACRECGRAVRLVRWSRDANPDAVIGICGGCGGEVAGQGYWKFHELSPPHLAPVWNRPLASWGVEPFAVISIRSAASERTFVVGGFRRGD